MDADTLPGIINDRNPEGGHPETRIQEQFFDQLEASSDGLIRPGHFRYLWALLTTPTLENASKSLVLYAMVLSVHVTYWKVSQCY